MTPGCLDSLGRTLALVTITCLGAASATAACLPPPPGMTGWWPGDDDATDIVAGRTAVLRGDATHAPGLVASAFSLDGDADFLEVPHDPALDVGTGDFAVDLWVRYDSLDGEQVLIEKYSENFGGPTQAGWTLTKLSSNALSFGWGSNGVTSGPVALEVNRWYFVVARRRGNEVAIFLDGALLAANSPPLVNLDGPASLKVGHRGNPSDTPGSTDTRQFWMRGRVDEIELFVGRALDDAEIAALFAARAEGKCKPGSIDCSGGAGQEPSALDLRPGSTPLTVARDGSTRLALAWEDTGAPEHAAWAGSLASLHGTGLYDHAPVACRLLGPRVSLGAPAADSYFLATSTCNGLESSYGRNSSGDERPAGAPPCP